MVIYYDFEIYLNGFIVKTEPFRFIDDAEKRMDEIHEQLRDTFTPVKTRIGNYSVVADVKDEEGNEAQYKLFITRRIEPLPEEQFKLFAQQTREEN